MTQEEKAKAYDEALEWMRKVYPTLTGADKEDAEHYFPELAESEDEKIRKVLIHIVKSACSKYGIKYIGDKITEEMLLAYIERQKEQKPVETAKEAWKEMRLEVYAQASGNRHEPNYSDDSTKMFSLCDIDEIFEKIGNRAVEQKPTENSGKELLYVSNKSYNIGYRDGKREALQKPAEWSEEDEVYLQYALWCVEKAEKSCKDGEDKGACWSAERWLKSLRPSWKPSEEQMYSLGSVVNGAGEATKGSIAYHLKELYEQLKKL